MRFNLKATRVVAAVLPLIFAAAPVYAQSATQPASSGRGWFTGAAKPVAGVTPMLVDLWDDSPTRFNATSTDRDDGTGRIVDVNIPGMIVYLPPVALRPAGAMPAMIACMGGAYTHLTRLVGADHTVETFVPKGIAIISLKYRLKPPSGDVARDALADGQRAMRLVRFHAKEWGIDPNKIGMVGWSAGSNLILNQSTHFDAGNAQSSDPVERESSRPDFAVMLSPWPNAKPVTDFPAAKDAPPAFIGSARDDQTAPFTFAESIVAEWKTAAGTAELMAVPTGGHGAFEIGTGTAGNWAETFLP
jgi:endo-1,4-beta-xylanase